MARALRLMGARGRVLRVTGLYYARRVPPGRDTKRGRPRPQATQGNDGQADHTRPHPRQGDGVLLRS